MLLYNPDLALLVDTGVELKAGGAEEIEIRANTVWAVERIRLTLAEKRVMLLPFDLEWLLCNLGRGAAFQT